MHRSLDTSISSLQINLYWQTEEFYSQICTDFIEINREFYYIFNNRKNTWVQWDNLSFPGGASGKDPACQCKRHKRHGFHPWVEKMPQRRAGQPTPVFLPEESHGQRSLADCSPWLCKESDTTEHTNTLYHSHAHLHTGPCK